MDGETVRIMVPLRYATRTATIVIPRWGPMTTTMTASRSLDTRISTTPRGTTMVRLSAATQHENPTALTMLLTMTAALRNNVQASAATSSVRPLETQYFIDAA